MHKKFHEENSMETLEFKLPYSDITILLDSIRHYIHCIESIDAPSTDEDRLADLYTDCENLKSLEKQIAARFAEKFGDYSS